MTNGAYDWEGFLWHQISNRLMIKILELWSDKKRPVVDLGCGLNYYMTVMYKAGYKVAGIDAVDAHNNLMFTRDLCEPMEDDKGIVMAYEKKRSDYTKPYTFLELNSLHNEVRNVLSLECGEHLPYEGSLVYLDNIVAVAQGGEVIMSWAIPGQAGHGHINCQTNAWVIEQMESRGYVINPELTLQLREAVRDCSCTWFRNTLMYFQNA